MNFLYSQQTKTKKNYFLQNNFSLKEITKWLFSPQISERLVGKMTILPSKIKQFVAKMIILLTIQGNDRLGQWPLKQRIPQRQNDDDKKFLSLEDTINNGEMLNYFCTEVEFYSSNILFERKFNWSVVPNFVVLFLGEVFPNSQIISQNGKGLRQNANSSFFSLSVQRYWIGKCSWGTCM